MSQDMERFTRACNWRRHSPQSVIRHPEEGGMSAQRPAGARKPASQTSVEPVPSSSRGSLRPDARTGRSRARRFSLLLPVLALLLGALCVLAAPLAAMADEEAEKPQNPPHEQTGTNGADDLRGGKGDDLLVGRRGNDELRGKDGNDELRGGWGNDLLRGGAGDDVLHGGRGRDVLRGGVGNDILHGGKGDDRFAFSLGASGHKIITDFETGDVIALGADPEGGSWPSPADIVTGVVAQDGHYTYTLLAGLTVETNTPLTVADFVFLGDAGRVAAHAVALPVGHSLSSWLRHNPGGGVTVPAGEHRDVGGVRFACPAGGADCEVTVTTEDGQVFTASATGGVATAGPVPPSYVGRPDTLPPPPPTETAPTTLAGATAHGIASAIASLRDEALGDQFTSWPVADRPLTFGAPYAALPLSLHRPSKGVLGGELDNDGDPSTPTGFVDADAPPAISGWTGSAREWSRTDDAGVTTTDTVAVYSKAISGESYLAFGWWSRVPDSSAVGVGTFGNAPFRSTRSRSRVNSLALQAAWPRGANVFVAGRHKYWPGFAQLEALTGTATYTGAAAGLWSERAAGERDGASGAFTADATLTADFDQARYLTLSGSIANFKDASGASLGNWTATLANEIDNISGGDMNGGGFVNSGNTAGAADGRNWSGGWVAQFFRRAAADPRTAIPTAVGGAFQAHHGTPTMAASNDRGFVGVIGAFGAEKQ